MMQEKFEYDEFVRLSECKSLVQDASRVGWTVGFLSGFIFGMVGIVATQAILKWAGV